MGREEIASLIAILQQQLDLGTENIALGSWHIHWETKRRAFVFDKCENDGYCEERPSVVAVDGEILDRGGPLFA